MVSKQLKRELLQKSSKKAAQVKVGARQKVQKAGKGGKKEKKEDLKKGETLKNALVENSAGRKVGADELGWKAVDVPDTLEDFGGFYGLEEIDGVDVKVVNGKVEFVVKDASQLKQVEEPAGDVGEPAEGAEEPAEDVVMAEAEQAAKKGKKRAASVKEEEPAEPSQDEAAESSEKEEEEAELDFGGVAAMGVELPEEVDLPQWSTVELSSTTLRGLSELGFTKPTAIQKSCIPLALQGEDLIGKASTGSGKTLAYGIPILERFLSSDARAEAPTGIIFTPTRELAHQVVDHLKLVAQFAPFSQYSIVSLTGGLSIQKQERVLRYQSSGAIVVATPGRFLELIERNEAIAKRMSNLELLVLDEADRLLQDGHFDEFEQILKIFRTNRTRPTRWQSLVFSATFAKELFAKLKFSGFKPGKKGDEKQDEQQEIIDLLDSKIHFKSKPQFVDLNPNKLHNDIIETVLECLPAERDLYLYYFLLMYPGVTLVFTNAIDSVKRLVPFLNNLNIPTFAIHSSMVQKQRLKNLENFKKASTNPANKDKSIVLIASDVAARGLDISGIQHVIHYHLPRSADVYIHRSGRTARSGSEGVSVMICSPQEVSGPLRNLRKTLSDDKARAKFRGASHKKWTKDVQRLPVESDIVAQLRERSVLAASLADDEISTKSLSKDDNWMKQAAEELGIEDLSDLEEDEYLKKNRTKKQNKKLDKNQAAKNRFKLKQLLKQNIRKDLRRSYLTGGLMNLADSIVKGVGHDNILGHDKTNALEQLKRSKKAKQPGAKPAGATGANYV